MQSPGSEEVWRRSRSVRLSCPPDWLPGIGCWQMTAQSLVFAPTYSMWVWGFSLGISTFYFSIALTLPSHLLHLFFSTCLHLLVIHIFQFLYALFPFSLFLCSNSSHLFHLLLFFFLSGFPSYFLVFSQWQTGALLNFNQFSCRVCLCLCVCMNKGVVAMQVMGEPFFLSGRQSVGVSSGEDSSGWFVWEEMGNTQRRMNQLTQTHTHTHKHATVHTHHDILHLHTRRLILLPLPLQHLASTPSMHQSKGRPKQPLWTVYHLYYFITFLRVFPNLILLHCHQMMSSLICSLCSFFFALPQIYRPQ